MLIDKYDVLKKQNKMPVCMALTDLSVLYFNKNKLH
jgi:hypothetical protein